MKLQNLIAAALLFLIIGPLFGSGMVPGSASADERYGKFSGLPKVTVLPDGYNVQLLEALTFIDSKQRKWHVPSGFKTNGASIPRFLWINYPPFTGKYRTAAFIHDHYCVTKDKKWQQVHRMFYDSMRAAGVDAATAKAMYAAVYLFGPRWTGRYGEIVLPNQIPDQQKTQIFEELRKWIEETRPTPKEIRIRARYHGLH